jgi:hypothetical protein
MFDSLTRALSDLSSRRRLLGVLAATPLAGGLLALQDAEDAAAKARRRRRKQRHKKRKNPGNRKKGCTPKSRATVCAGTCGTVKNRQTCGKMVDCGSCACSPACGVCFTCQGGPNTPGTCVVDPAQQGDSCGSAGQVCQPDGSCACIPITQCPAGKICGTVPDGCGGEVACPVTCANPTPVCSNDNICVPCTGHAQCGAASICLDGLCHACDVCQAPALCDFTSVQAAIDDPAQLETIYVCPGTYVENAAQFAGVSITRAVHLIGAGDEANAAANTILSPGATNKSVVEVVEATPVTIQGLRLTGSSGANGRGLAVFSSQVAVATCTITGNVSDVSGGGIATAGPGTEVTLTNSRVTGNTGSSAGGVDIQGAGARLILDTLSRITRNTGSGIGGIRALSDTSAELPSVDNATGNTSTTGANNCGGGGAFTGPGAVCTTS